MITFVMALSFFGVLSEIPSHVLSAVPNNAPISSGVASGSEEAQLGGFDSEHVSMDKNYKWAPECEYEREGINIIMRDS